MARERHAALGARPAVRHASLPHLRDPFPRRRGAFALLVPFPLGAGPPIRGAAVPLVRGPVAELRGALPPVVPAAVRPGSPVRGSPFAFVLDAPFGAGAPYERPVPFLLFVLVVPSVEPSSLPLGRFLAPQRLAARLNESRSTARYAGAAPGGARSRSPSRMPA